MLDQACKQQPVLQVLAKGLGEVTEAEQWVRQDSEALEKLHRTVCHVPSAAC